MSKSFKTLGLVARREHPTTRETLDAVINLLGDYDLILDAASLKFTEHKTLQTAPRQKLGALSDLVLVIGGDGSLLNTAHDIVDSGTPLVGINRGKLGFLTDLTPSALEENLIALLQGKHTLEERFLLKATVKQGDTVIAEDTALNEVVLLAADSPHMICFNVEIDKNFACCHRSDGYLVATPTGSTAYALSGGGPILHPSLDALTLLPLFPHTLTSRPIVIHGNNKITIKLAEDDDHRARVSCDARPHLLLNNSQQLEISKYHKPLYLLHPLDYDYYRSLRTKLHWSNKT